MDASSSAKVVNDVIFYLVGICIFLLSLITFLMVYFVIRYRKQKNPHPSQIEGNLWLELTWTVAPTFLVLAMFYYGWTGFEFLKKTPQGAMEINVTARQWSWLFEYPNGVKDTELTVPVGNPVRLSLTSSDVIHGLYVPAFRIKQDAVPGMKTYLWFQAAETGIFDLLCSQYCGLQHAHMLSKVIVLSQKDFDQWYEKKQIEMVSLTKGPSLGLELYKEKGCIACHSLDGTIRVGPSFKDLYGNNVKVLTGDKEHTVLADDAYIRKSIVDPNADIAAGFRPNLMPKLDLTPDQISALIEFIKSQSSKGEVKQVSSRGYELYREKGCADCHTTDGSPGLGPTFKGLFGKTEKVITAGKERTVVVDEAFIRKYIDQPNVDIVAGFQPVMPKIPLTVGELTVLVEFIKSVK